MKLLPHRHANDYDNARLPDDDRRTDDDRRAVHEHEPDDRDGTGATEARSERARHAYREDTYRDERYDMFHGVRWGSAFFGWLVAMGIAVIVLAVLAAAGVALGLTDRLPSTDEVESAAQSNVERIGVGGAIALVAVLFVAYLAGGYVAGRMARFDGPQQGAAVWVVGLVLTVAAAIAGALAGAEYNVLNRLDLPRIPVDEGSATWGSVITLIAVLVLTLVGAVLGGRLGEAYHRRIDRRTDEIARTA